MRTKRRWAEEGRFLTGMTARPESERLPPGQHLVSDWPVLDLGEHPKMSRADWRLTIDGAVEHPTMRTWEAFLSQPQTESVSDTRGVRRNGPPRSTAQFLARSRHSRRQPMTRTR
jgi:DMSO/TMAO reductase YedYZ molybdopterin-dependent catalytic subunit